MIRDIKLIRKEWNQLSLKEKKQLWNLTIDWQKELNSKFDLSRHGMRGRIEKAEKYYNGNNLYKNYSYYVIYALYNDKIIGWGFITPGYRKYLHIKRNKKEFDNFDIYVNKKYRNLGIGFKILQKAIKTNKRKLYVYPHDLISFKFFNKFKDLEIINDEN